MTEVGRRTYRRPRRPPPLHPHGLSAQTFFLAEFLEREGYEPPKLSRTAVVHGHCHHKSLLKMADVEHLLTRLGVDFETLDAGCCGLAGSFGYEADHYDISMQIGERVLLPAVRESSPDTLVVADGFSCREQIAHATGRRALHLAEVLQLALREEASGRTLRRESESARR